MNNETAKLINVLRRIARAAGYASWVKSDAETARFCAAQYNRVLARLNAIEPDTRTLFVPVSPESSPDVVRMAARDLAAYFEDDAPEPPVWGFALGCQPRKARTRVECFPLSVRCD
jgi:hypothetical protein